jgi:hypothetical protein
MNDYTTFETELRLDNDDDIQVEITYDVDADFYDAINIISVKEQKGNTWVEIDLSNSELLECETLAMQDNESNTERAYFAANDYYPEDRD